MVGVGKAGEEVESTQEGSWSQAHFKHPRSAWQLSAFSIWALPEAPLACWPLVLPLGVHSFSWLVCARLPGFLDAEPGAGSRALFPSFTLQRVTEHLLFAGCSSGEGPPRVLPDALPAMLTPVAKQRPCP